MHAPFSLVVNHKLKYAVSIGSAEDYRVFSWRTRNGWKGSSNEGVEHGEFELKVRQARVRLP